ncbi:FAD-dependent oxidoreductase [Saccharopolyspora shandongensis]|uniref:FAD-dependent oxidoreductase n=1 Tax=Saccharopolyspora shandongensis TaxID=418495 RepID=UPI0034234E39
MPVDETQFDAVVVGAGPAGSAAALELARAGRRVALLERGPFPGSKNVYGGVVYGRILDEVAEQWWSEVPVQRWITRRSTMMLTPTQSISVDFRSQDWSGPPHNGMTTYRADFDSWLAGKAVGAGAELITSTVATELLREDTGRIVGVRTDRPDGDLRAPVVIACDGVNSFLAKSAGLLPAADAEHHTLGVKETLALPRGVLEDRFGLGPDDGLDIEMVGCTGPIAGGGFLYTNKETVSIGLVLALSDLARSGRRPEELLAELKAHPSIAPMLRGSELKEYSAHLIPEGGYDHMPRLATDGLLLAGDAAGMCLAAGIWLEGVNFAIGSGLVAGRTAARALVRGDVTVAGLAQYRQRLADTFVLADHRRLRRAPGFVLSPRVQHEYPGLVCDFLQHLFTVDNPEPKPRLGALLRRTARRRGIKLTDLARDALAGMRAFR